MPMSKSHLDFVAALQAEATVMLKYVASSGLQVPPGATGVVAEMELALSYANQQYTIKESPSAGTLGIDKILLEKLTKVHNKLSVLIAPATPRGIAAIYPFKNDRNLFKRTFGNVRIGWMMMLAGVFFLCSFFFFSLFDAVNGNPNHANPLTNCGVHLLLNELFFLSAAGLGAAFAALVQANKYIRQGNFDQRYESSYWLQLLLGMIAGIVLAQLLSAVIYKDAKVVAINPVCEGFFHIEDRNGTLKSTTGESAVVGVLAKGDNASINEGSGSRADEDNGSRDRPYYAALFALIGGFSSSLVYRLMTRIKEAIESLFRADIMEQVELREQQAKARMQSQLLQSSARQLRQMVTLQNQLATMGASKEIQDELSSTISAMDAEQMSV
jgi:hypothetical protein